MDINVVLLAILLVVGLGAGAMMQRDAGIVRRARER